MLTLTCEHCGTTFFRLPHRRRHGRAARFCSRVCSSADFKRTDAERFWVKVNKDGPVPDYRPDLGPCWVWTAHTSTGYGRFAVNDERGWHFVQAHRWAYEQIVGPIPTGFDLDHLCRVHPCVNPEHLEPVTRRENVKRGISPSMRLHLAGRCMRGHEMTPENTYSRAVKGNECRTCKDARDRARVRKKATG